MASAVLLPAVSAAGPHNSESTPRAQCPSCCCCCCCAAPADPDPAALDTCSQLLCSLWRLSKPRPEKVPSRTSSMKAPTTASLTLSARTSTVIRPMGSPSTLTSRNTSGLLGSTGPSGAPKSSPREGAVRWRPTRDASASRCCSISDRPGCCCRGGSGSGPSSLPTPCPSSCCSLSSSEDEERSDGPGDDLPWLKCQVAMVLLAALPAGFGASPNAGE
jgi:hypothetical protein